MNTIKKRNRIVLCLCSILVMFATIFAFIPFNKETKVVKADTVDITYDFVGSNICFPTYLSIMDYHGDIVNLGTNFINMSISFSVNSSNAQVSLFQSSYLTLWEDTYGEGSLLDSNPVVVPMDNQFHHFNLNLGTHNNNQYFVNSFILCSSSNFISNIDHIYIGSYLDYPISIQGWFDYFNYVKYVDINGNFLIFCIPISFFDAGDIDNINDPSKFAFTLRKYYLLNDFSDNDYYDSGFNSGFTSGVQQGESSGYNKGYQSGKDDGYWIGYDEALNNTNKYSFTSLISAVIDVPVQTFTNLFNFEILGVNLSGFFLGLLTCCIVIGVIRLIL